MISDYMCIYIYTGSWRQHIITAINYTYELSKLTIAHKHKNPSNLEHNNTITLSFLLR